MINKIGVLGQITVYEDPLMDDDKLYRGRKDNCPTFIIVSTKVSKILSNIILRKERREKLNNIKEILEE